MAIPKEYFDQVMKQTNDRVAALEAENYEFRTRLGYVEVELNFTHAENAGLRKELMSLHNELRLQTLRSERNTWMYNKKVAATERKSRTLEEAINGHLSSASVSYKTLSASLSEANTRYQAELRQVENQP